MREAFSWSLLLAKPPYRAEEKLTTLPSLVCGIGGEKDKPVLPFSRACVCEE